MIDFTICYFNWCAVLLFLLFTCSVLSAQCSGLGQKNDAEKFIVPPNLGNVRPTRKNEEHDFGALSGGFR